MMPGWQGICYGGWRARAEIALDPYGGEGSAPLSYRRSGGAFEARWPVRRECRALQPADESEHHRRQRRSRAVLALGWRAADGVGRIPPEAGGRDEWRGRHGHDRGITAMADDASESMEDLVRYIA